MLPDQIELTNADSYRAAADLYGKAGQKFQDDAIALIEEQKKSATQALSRRTSRRRWRRPIGALQEKKMPEAFAAYRKAADLGNPAAMHNVGLLYETRDRGQRAIRGRPGGSGIAVRPI